MNPESVAAHQVAILARGRSSFHGPPGISIAETGDPPWARSIGEATRQPLAPPVGFSS